ncbi:hypothetical protein HMPREF0476_0225 [Kingella kingae ATCC 23330]|uniref:Lipopolysaccharide assembly protein A domain-containing protein n=2 Tax=Kingella kingae TaxID=504 RepID=F5S4U2_KINKI|nr:hypothetical protein HMPREF0476_0225 [Kingella kingae ATCC 23330]
MVQVKGKVGDYTRAKRLNKYQICPKSFTLTAILTSCSASSLHFFTTGAIMKLFYLIIKAIVLIFFLILALINFQRVPFSYLPSQQMELPLIVVMFGMFVVGAIFGMFALFGRLLRLRSENARLRAEVQKSARLATQDIAAPVQAASDKQ